MELFKRNGYMVPIYYPAEKLEYTDWLIVRHSEELLTSSTTSLTDEELADLVAKRKQWRAEVNTNNPLVCRDIISLRKHVDPDAYFPQEGTRLND